MASVRARDRKFLALLAAALCLAAICVLESFDDFGSAGYPGGPSGRTGARGTYREIDIRQVQRMLIRGELSSREALFYDSEKPGR